MVTVQELRKIYKKALADYEEQSDKEARARSVEFEKGDRAKRVLDYISKELAAHAEKTEYYLRFSYDKLLEEAVAGEEADEFFLDVWAFKHNHVEFFQEVQNSLSVRGFRVCLPADGVLGVNYLNDEQRGGSLIK